MPNVVTGLALMSGFSFKFRCSSGCRLFTFLSTFFKKADDVDEAACPTLVSFAAAGPLIPAADASRFLLNLRLFMVFDLIMGGSGPHTSFFSEKGALPTLMVTGFYD